MADIRSFFGPRSSQEEKTKPKRRIKNVICLSDDEDERPQVKNGNSKPSSKREKLSNVEQEIDSSKFFKDALARKSTRSSSKPALPVKKYVKQQPNDEDEFADFDDHTLMELDESPPTSKRKSPNSAGQIKSSSSKKAAASSKKRKTAEDEDDEFIAIDQASDDNVKKESTVSRKKSTSKAKPSTVVKKSESEPAAENKVVTSKRPKKLKVNEDEDLEMKTDPSPEKKKPAYQFWKKERTGPKAPGSKEIPQGTPDCLAGLTFVFTGELSSIGREEAVDLAKRYGARVTGAPSRKTNYVVLGEDAGPAKLQKIKELKIKTVDEEGFFDLIRSTSEGISADPAAEARAVAAKKKEDEEIKRMAAELEAEEAIAKSQANSHAKSKANQNSSDPIASASVDNQLWTTKYMPTKIKDICGNKGHVEKLVTWLRNWHNDFDTGKKVKPPGPFVKDMSQFRAVLISGPPGIGKTTAAHLAARLEGYDPIEFNASDTRSKKLLESSVSDMIDNRSISGYFGGTSIESYHEKEKIVIIMDEVDGMSAGDRGGIGAMNALIKVTKVPIICICNERSSQKIKPLTFTCYDMRFIRPQASMIRSRLMSIAYKEKLELPSNVIDQLVQVAQSDIRQVLNMLSMYRVTRDKINFDEAKDLGSMSEKNISLTPWTIVAKLFAASTWNPSNKISLNDKIELYFHDHAFAPLMVQENYLNTQPTAANGSSPEAVMKQMELTSKAADSISDGDLVDSMIHGSQQHWSLMPLHGALSCVRPASFIYGPGKGGQGGGGGGYGGYQFSSWLGKNSSSQKNSRLLREVQVHMWLRVSADKNEIRQSYLPALFPLLTGPLAMEGSEAVPKVIDLMDAYFLDREDWETIAELSLTKAPETASATKSAFTRTYNKMKHPIAFNKPSTVSKVKGAVSGEVPDYEDAIEEDEPVDVSDVEEVEGDDDEDIHKDKLIKDKAAKRKGSSTSTKEGGRGGSSSSRGRGRSGGRGKK